MTDRIDVPCLILGACLGALLTVALASRNGEDMARESARIVAACAAQCSAEDEAQRAVCDAAHDATEAATRAHAETLRELADRCVLSLPSTERLRGAKVRREPVIETWVDPPMDGGHE
jgi:surfactin synthase thioesterase subunit